MKTITLNNSYNSYETPDNFSSGRIIFVDSSDNKTILNICTYKNEKLHSYNDEPAYINTISGYKSWFKNGNRHRGNGKPAMIYPATRLRNRECYYYINGKEATKVAAETYSMLFAVV